MPPTPRHGLANLGRYPLGESTVPGVSRVINLANNECATPPSPRALAAAHEAMVRTNRYPNPACDHLRRALGERHDVAPELIVCGNGSGELIELLAMAYAGPGDEILTHEYGYLFFKTAARIVGATPVPVPARGLAFDADAALAMIDERTRLLFLANPNNPTGAVLPVDELERFADALPDHVLLVLDAAYAEYVERNDFEVGARLVERHANVVMLRTFSKIYGLAGLRLGWAYCPEPVAHVLHAVRTPDNVSTPAQAAGLAALGDVAFFDAARRRNRELRGWFADRAAGLGLEPCPSEGNFLLVRFADAEAAARTHAALRSRGILLRPMAPYDLPDCLRVTIGAPDEMEQAATALAEAMEG